MNTDCFQGACGRGPCIGKAMALKAAVAMEFYHRSTFSHGKFGMREASKSTIRLEEP